MSTRVSPAFESVELNSSSPMLSDFPQTDRERSASEREASPAAAAMENSPTEKQIKKRKKKGIRAFFRRIGKAIKLCTLCCYGDNILPPFPCDDPADLQPGLSGLEWALSIDPCPSGIELTVNANPDDLEVSSVSEPSSLEVTSDSEQADPEPLLVPGPSSFDLKLTLDPVLSKLVSETINVPGSSSLDVTPVPSLSSIEMNSDVDPTEPKPSSVLGPSTLDSEITPVPGPSGFEAAVEQLTKRKKKGISAVFRRTWRAVKRAALCCQRDNKVAPDPSPVPGPSGLNNEPVTAPRQSGCEPVEKTRKMRKKKDIQAFFQPTGRTVKFPSLAPDLCRVEPVDLQPGPSGPLRVLIHDPHPPCFEVTVTANQDPPDSRRGPFSLNSHLTHDPGPAGLVVELMSVTGLSSQEIMPVSSLHSLKLTADTGLDVTEQKPIQGSYGLEPTADMGLDVPELKPIPGSSGLELTADMRLDVPELKPIPGSSLVLTPAVDLTDPQPSSSSASSSCRLTPETDLDNSQQKPVPILTGFWPTAASLSSRYDVGVKLGEGGFGSVYEGTRRSSGQKVAIKFLPKKPWNQFINMPGSTKHLLSEVAMNVMVQAPPKSPYIVQMIEWFDQPHQFVIVMEYPHPCETLLAFTMRHGYRLDESVVRGLMRQAVRAAKHCIERGIFHKDLKTDNMLVNTETLQLKLIDFSCSERINTCCSEDHQHAVRSTVWSLAIAFLEVVSGDQPISVFLSNARHPFIPNFSSEFRDLIEQCLVRHQTNRPTLEEILEHPWFKQD